MARPPSAAYRFQKMVRRNKVTFTAASAMAFALVLGLAISTWQFIREKAARRAAQVQTVKSQQVAQFLKDMLNGVEPSVARFVQRRRMKRLLHPVDPARRFLSRWGELTHGKQATVALDELATPQLAVDG